MSRVRSPSEPNFCEMGKCIWGGQTLNIHVFEKKKPCRVSAYSHQILDLITILVERQKIGCRIPIFGPPCSERGWCSTPIKKSRIVYSSWS
ncbi:hypothetical protein Y032_0513g2764 [Ancylostoma ceylanicum]|uniref:Uncharacterized protein n=1 Tax=Ancylostoma ceylanicum TaxID=53326 RepID=A0A016WV41_9BILA|nr:hypothetical protein Y032_0513g2764 [Ancylostoma ceylanicum]